MGLAVVALVAYLSLAPAERQSVSAIRDPEGVIVQELAPVVGDIAADAASDSAERLREHERSTGNDTSLSVFLLETVGWFGRHLGALMVLTGIVASLIYLWALAGRVTR